MLAAFRPTGRVVGERVAHDNATRAVASDELVSAVQDVSIDGFLAWDGMGPDYRTTLLLHPNTYGGGGNYAWRSIVGTDPESRSVLASSVPNGGVLHSYGSIYLENLHLIVQSNEDKTGPKYPWHITGGEVCIAAHCTFDLSQIAPDTVVGGNGVAGWTGSDGASGMTMLFYGCDFVSGPVANGLNFHGPASGEELVTPMTLMFVDCTGLDDVEVFAPGGVATDGEGSRLYVVNTPVAAVGAEVGCHVYTDGDAPAMSAHAGTIHRNESAWPVPEGGLSDPWRDYYYPSVIGQTDHTATVAVTDAAPFAPVPSRIYLTRIRLDEAMRATGAGVTVTTPAGKMSMAISPADTPYVRDEPPVPGLHAPNTPVAAGPFAFRNHYAYTRYPGDNGIWARMAFDSASLRVLGSAQLPGLTDCYYSDDGVTIIPVTAGTAHPLMFLQAD